MLNKEITHKGQEYDRDHILQLLRKRNCKAAVTGNHEASQEGTKDSMYLSSRVSNVSLIS